jgi:pyruvate,water dikinase
MYVSLASTIGPGVLAQLCAAAGAPELHLDLLSGLGEVTSAAPSRELWQLSRLLREEPELLAALEHDPRRVVDAARDGQSRFATGLARFLVDRGFYGPSGWDLLAPSWEVEPGQLVGMLRRLVRSPESEAPEHAETRLAQRRVEAAAVVRARLASDESAAATFDASLRSTSVFVAAREQTKANATRLINEVRVTALELGRRAVESGALEQTADVSMVLESELDEFAVDPVRFVPVVHERRAYLARLHEVEPPFIIGPSGPPPAQWRRRSTATVHDEAPAGTRLTAIGCSPGTYRGRVRVIRQVDDDVEIDAGDILVAPFSDVGWTPLFLVAGAAVLEVGSMNSHAAVISRELGIPCVVSLGGATDLLRDGAVVTVDGTAGSVTVDDPAPPPPS